MIHNFQIKRYIMSITASNNHIQNIKTAIGEDSLYQVIAYSDEFITKYFYKDNLAIPNNNRKTECYKSASCIFINTYKI